MPRSKSGQKRVPINPEAMRNAIEAVCAPPDKCISIREASRVYNIKFATLVRQLRSLKTSSEDKYEYKAKYDVNKVFSNDEEEKLVEYIVTVAKMQYGLNKKGVRELAYKFAVANKKKYPCQCTKKKK